MWLNVGVGFIKGKIAIYVHPLHVSTSIESYSWLYYIKYCINLLSFQFVFKSKQKLTPEMNGPELVEAAKPQHWVSCTKLPHLTKI